MQRTEKGISMDGKPLKWFKGIFLDLKAPGELSVKGIHRAEFVGPSWLRRTAEPGLALTGLKGWWGKEFYGNGCGTNLLSIQGSLRRALPMNVSERASLIDGKLSFVVSYPRESPYPWAMVVDELRRLDDSTLLGMTTVRGKLAKILPLPFLLHQSEKPDGL